MAKPSNPVTTNPQTHSHKNNLTIQISTMKLNGKNFIEWSQSAKISLMEKENFKYANGTLFAPATTDLIYEVWEIENSFVMFWLLHSMQLEISKTYLLLPIVCDI